MTILVILLAHNLRSLTTTVTFELLGYFFLPYKKEIELLKGRKASVVFFTILRQISFNSQTRLYWIQIGRVDF